MFKIRKYSKLGKIYVALGGMGESLIAAAGADAARSLLELDDNLANLTAAEIAQLGKIGTTTISAGQWGYVGGADQAVKQADSPTFAGIKLSGLTDNRVVIVGTGGVLEDDANLVWDGSALGIKTQKELRFYEGANYIGFEAPALAANQIWVLPNADGSANDFLQTDGSGNLSWAAAGAGSGYTEGARVYNSGNVSCPNSAWTAITFDTELYDTDGIHSVVSNTERLTCKTSGVYVISGHVVLAASAGGYHRLTRIFLNGTTVIAYNSGDPIHASTEALQSIGTVYNLSVNDYVTLEVNQNSGGALNTVPASQGSPHFAMQRIG